MNIINNWIASLAAKFISVDAICILFAKLIAKLLTYASKKGGDKWDKSKSILKKTAVWINLFNEVYEDDEMTSEEEELVANAIKNQTNVEKIVEILNKKECK